MHNPIPEVPRERVQQPAAWPPNCVVFTRDCSFSLDFSSGILDAQSLFGVSTVGAGGSGEQGTLEIAQIKGKARVDTRSQVWAWRDMAWGGVALFLVTTALPLQRNYPLLKKKATRCFASDYDWNTENTSTAFVGDAGDIIDCPSPLARQFFL